MNELKDSIVSRIVLVRECENKFENSVDGGRFLDDLNIEMVWKRG